MLNVSMLQRLVTEAIHAWLPNAVLHENIRPVWLHGMELDVYIPILNIAIEIQGNQHYYWTPMLQKQCTEFTQQRWRDRRKQQICNQQRILLLTIRGEGSDLERLRRKVRRALQQPLPMTPRLLRGRWRKHCKILGQKDWPKFKVHRTKIIPTNRSSRLYLKSNVLR